MQFWILLGLGAVCCAVAMVGLWALALRRRNFSYVDIGWSANFALLAVLYGAFGAGDQVRRTVICLMYGIWSLRLTIHLSRRIVGHPEEGRYVQLRETWGRRGALNLKFLAFFEFQGLLNVILSLPMLLVAFDPDHALNSLHALGVGLWLAALIGEGVADSQLARFKRQSQNRGKVCRIGLWSVSRHPNYFFEWLIWVAYAVFAFSSPYGWIGVSMPVLMLHFLLNVTGVKPTEAQALSSRGEEYRRYQQAVSPFIPWFPKTIAKGDS